LLLLFPTPIANEPPVEVQPKAIDMQQESPSRSAPQVITMEVTAYCNCYQCTGKHPGDKHYGITATGTRAGKGTVAADFSVLSPGTRLSISGYGEGIVSDRGGSIKGNKLDIWFPSHSEALMWGRRTVRVKIIKDGTK
jgi:3D (Asp-Asp-Asp) domain-containing protein